MGKKYRSSICATAAVLMIAGASGQEPRFSRDVYPVLGKAGCESCHTADGVASVTRLQFPPPGSDPEKLEAFGLSLRALIDPSDPQNSLLLAKPTRRMPHVGGQRITPGSEEEAVLRAWILHLANLPSPASASPEVFPAHVPSIPLRRLTHSQYNNTVRDLLGDITAPARSFPPEDFVDGFKNQSAAQSISPLLAEGYSSAAEQLARNVFRVGDSRGLLPCKPSAPSDPACRNRFIRDFGLKAFRRPLNEIEVERYAALFDRHGSFLQGAQIVVETMLQSPNFLFLPNSEAAPSSKAFARAARMAYFLWDSMPDDALLQKAASGELDAREGVERVARRMLADPKARDAVHEFTSQWLRFDQVINQLKERRQYPQFTRELALAMTEETRRFVDDLVWNDRNFPDLFTADYTFINADLANVYKLTAPATEFGRVSYSADSDRAGILGQGTFLSLTSKPADTSPTARGLFVREHFLCQKVPLPPPGTNMNLPPLTEDKPRTNRERLGIHLSNESCAGCHNLIDPIGLGLEKFDAIGGRRERFKITYAKEGTSREEKPKVIELALDTSGWIAGLPEARFTSPKELGAILASTPQCQECIVKQLFRFAMGRQESPADRPVIDSVFQDFRGSKFRFKELMISLIKWTEFPPGDPGK